MKNFLKKSLMFSWKLLDEFMNAPWRVEEFPLTRLHVRQGEWNGVLENGWIGWFDEMFPFPIYMKVCVSTLHPIHHRAIVVYISVLSYRITYTSATEDQTFENQHVPVADALKPICHICHGAVADECCPLQMICLHSPLIHRMICFPCSVAVIVADVLK